MYYKFNLRKKKRRSRSFSRSIFYSCLLMLFYFFKFLLIVSFLFLKTSLVLFKKLIFPSLKIFWEILINLFLPVYKVLINYRVKRKQIIEEDRKDFLSFITFIFSNRATIHILVFLIIIFIFGNNLYIKKARGIEISKKADHIFKPQIDIEPEELEKVDVIVNNILPPKKQDSVLRSYPIINSKVDQEGFILLEEKKSLSNLPMEKYISKGGEKQNNLIRKEIIEYTVKPGDTVYDIAIEYGVDVDSILWANNLTARSIIKPGDKLLIPPVSGIIHTVKKGDTLSKIAKLYKAKLEDIKEFNNITEDSILKVGQKIIVPGGKKPAPRYVASRYIRKYSSYKTNYTSYGFLWPLNCRRITQYFKGWRHTGIDIACPKGSPIRAVADGVVVKAGWTYVGYGYRVVIRHSKTVQTLYAHMLPNLQVYPGQKVKKGQIIGYEGSTGRSTGPHLHFEIIIRGRRVNPLNYY